MTNNAVFNATVCIMGILIFAVHVVNLLVKKEKRKDEWSLLAFFVFTIVHFAVYLTFTFVKTAYTSNPFVIAFYTTFYLFNNVEVLLLFRYMLSYVEVADKIKKPLNILAYTLFGVFVVLDIVNVFTGIFFGAQDGQYVRSKAMIVSQSYQFVMFAMVFLVAVCHKKLNVREKIAFATYCFLPLASIVLQNIFKGYAIAYASIVLAAEVLFFFISVQRDIALSEQKEKNKDAQIKIMLSQIQPHFMYNSLSAISTLIPMDPPRAQIALDDFTAYLRLNLSSLTESRLIPFEWELKHIKTYISLEKMRFNDRINVKYDIWATDFEVPPLSIQPIVENAVKHGVLQKLEGGTVTITAYETPHSYVVKIEDDGVGFDINKVDFVNDDHFGINNIKYRIAKMSNGELDIKSEQGVGTVVTVTFGKGA